MYFIVWIFISRLIWSDLEILLFHFDDWNLICCCARERSRSRSRWFRCRTVLGRLYLVRLEMTPSVASRWRSSRPLRFRRLLRLRWACCLLKAVILIIKVSYFLINWLTSLFVIFNQLFTFTFIYSVRIWIFRSIFEFRKILV